MTAADGLTIVYFLFLFNSACTHANGFAYNLSPHTRPSPLPHTAPVAPATEGSAVNQVTRAVSYVASASGNVAGVVEFVPRGTTIATLETVVRWHITGLPPLKKYMLQVRNFGDLSAAGTQ